MRAVLTNLGTTGDIWPFLALAIELRRHGHQPILALSPNFASLADRPGIKFVPIGLEFKFEKLRDMLAEISTAPTAAKQVRPLLIVGMQALPQMFHELCEICRDSDVIIGGTGQPAARMVHEAIGIPFVSVHTVGFAIWGTSGLREVA